MPANARRKGVIALTLLIGATSCFELFSSKRPNPENCVASPEVCVAPLVCNQETGACASPVTISCEANVKPCPDPYVCNTQVGKCEDPRCAAAIGTDTTIGGGSGSGTAVGTGAEAVDVSLCAVDKDAGIVALNDAATQLDALSPDDLTIRGPSDAWAVGQNGIILRWKNGMGWSTVTSGTGTTLRGVWGASSNDVWAVGVGGMVIHWDGSTWSRNAASMSITGITANEDLYGVWGSAFNNVWFVGANATIINLNGGANKVTPSLGGAYYSVYGNNANDVWIVGAGGAIQRWTGGPMLIGMSNTTGSGDLFGVWTSGVNSIWAVGRLGAIIYSNGGAFVSQNSNAAANLQGIWGTSATSQRVAGGNGTIRVGNGSTNWITAASGVMDSLNAVWGVDVNDIWYVGAAGKIVHWDGSNHQTVASGTNLDLYAVFGFP